MRKSNIKINHWIFFLLGGALFFIFSCNDEKKSDWFGKWQMKSIETGNVTLPVDTIYFNFQTDLFLFQIYSPSIEKRYEFYGFNKIEGDSIHFLLECKPQPESPFWEASHWNNESHSYFIKNINHKELILSDQERTYIFHKF